MPRNVLNANEDLEIAVSKRNESSIVRLRGRLNVNSSPALRDRLMALLQAQSPEAVIVILLRTTTPNYEEQLQGRKRGDMSAWFLWLLGVTASQNG